MAPLSTIDPFTSRIHWVFGSILNLKTIIQIGTNFDIL